MSPNPDDITALTPAHFLNMSTAGSAPDEELSECKANYLSRWQVVQKLAQEFWEKWRFEYLHQLQVRNKWNQKSADIAVGELVMLKEHNLPSSKWPLARVTAVHPGKDGLVRVVTVKTASKVLKRGITEVAPLPIRR